VFDEYNEDQPFYSAKSKKIEATRHDYLSLLGYLELLAGLIFLALTSFK
jgi:hypothetical protein